LSQKFSVSDWLWSEGGSINEPPAFVLPHEKEDRKDSFRFKSFAPQKPKAPQLRADGKFCPVSHFIEGWKGDSLYSKNVFKFEGLLSVIESDVKNELFKTKDFPRSIKLGLFQEFMCYAKAVGEHFDIDDPGRFWNLIDQEKLKKNPKLLDFIDIYANRVATVIFFKLRFISHLMERCKIEVSDKALLYPSAFLNQIFRRGSQYELHSQALESNIYSWYQPTEHLRETMKEMLLLSRELSITEITKHISSKTQITQDKQKLYSHALSQISSGLFLNSLIENFPVWLETVEGKALGLPGKERVISTKFFGDYLESLSLSHWLAQDDQKHVNSDEIICPTFKGTEFISGTFTKICNEFQLLTFLAQKSAFQSEQGPIEYICRIMGAYFRNRKGSGSRTGLLLEDISTSTYDRIVLNLCHFSKNPQHTLFTQIDDQIKYLKPHGYLFVISSKKLFVTSLRERLEPILRELKTEAIIDLEQVKGKGELGSYIYIFRKMSGLGSDPQDCSYFRISANLENFNKFSEITTHLNSFYLAHLADIPPMAQLEFEDSFRIEFFQEAVVNGMLIHSTSEDNSRITHPAYFKGLLDNCVPMDMLFDIRALDKEDKRVPLDFGLNLGQQRDPSYFIMVDFRSEHVNLELHPMDTFRSIRSDNGETHCCYFQLTPKSAGLNPNILRNYFLTPVGKQVAGHFFSVNRGVKARLSKFLVPKFLTQTEALPDHLRLAFDSLNMTEKQLLEANPQGILKTFNHVDQIAKELFPRYACEILSRFSNLERQLQAIIWKLDDSRLGQRLSFSNPEIQRQLVLKKTFPITPYNEDVYTQFVSVASDIHQPLTSCQIQVSNEGEIKLYCLELFSGNKVVARLHSEEPMIQFLHLIMQQATNVSIMRILKAIQVPSLVDLKAVINDTQNLSESYNLLLKNIQTSIMNAFRHHVTSFATTKRS